MIHLQARHHILHLQREDREILWEGVDTLTHEELVEACKDRAMRFYGVSDEMMRDQMHQWLELSSHKDIPPLLLLWSRSITMTHSRTEKAPEVEEAVEELKVEEPILAEAGEKAADSDELLPVVEEMKEQPLEMIQEEEKRQKEEELQGYCQ